MVTIDTSEQSPPGLIRPSATDSGLLDQQVPGLPRLYMPRPLLWERLDRSTEGPMTLLVAPVGAGKTLGVAGWLRYTSAPQAAHALWVHGDRRWTPEQLTPILDNSFPVRPSATPSAPRRLVVIDDAHALPAASLRLLDDTLNEDPEACRTLLISRWDLPMSRLVPELRGHLTILRGGLLRMDDVESTALAAAHARTTDADVLRAVVHKAQGWCAAVVLAARAIGSAPDPAASARRYIADGTTVADRVASEAFATLTPRQRHLLLCVAGEGLVSSTTATHLSRDPQAGELLAELEALGLLVTRAPSVPAEVEDREVRYRIHPLLGEVVRRRLAVGGVDVAQARATVRRSALLDLARGRAREAFGRLVSVNAYDGAAQALTRQGVRLVLGKAGDTAVDDFVHAEPATIEQFPETWFPIALDRWIVDDVDAARYWSSRILRHEGTAGDAAGDDVGDRPVSDADLEAACVKLWLAHLDLEPVHLALDRARQVTLASRERPSAPDVDPATLAVLMHEVGITENWLGELSQAEHTLTAAISLARDNGLHALAASAMSHLAFTYYMAGREQTCVELATKALGLLGSSADVGAIRFAASRARLALFLGTLFDLPWPAPPMVPAARGTDPASSVHSADLCTRFWLQIRDTRLEFLRGSVSEAERILSAPSDRPQLHETRLPHHLRVVRLVEFALLAALSADQATLKAIEEDLAGLRADGEANLVAGLRAAFRGDRRGAASAFETAAAEARCAQPATRTLALVCKAQLLDALGQLDDAQRALAAAAASTEVRRNALPFLGWSRQGTPVESLLTRLDSDSSSAWVHDLAMDLADRPDVTAIYAPSTPTPRERESIPDTALPPVLSPRERDVLAELARGATYADIAAELVVSENTVKSHVSSLYGRLGVSRRSEALAVARSLHLL